jgi:hypothetical protein
LAGVQADHPRSGCDESLSFGWAVLDVSISGDDHPAGECDTGYPVDVFVARLHRAGWTV